MTPSEIKPGMKFGHWEVIKYDHTNKHRIKYFLCKCDVCGSIRPVRGVSLTQGASIACSRDCANSLIGQKIGRWNVIKKDVNRKRYYICQCDCGTKKSVYRGSLLTKNTLSCGCLKREKTINCYKQKTESLVGKVYGNLTVLEPTLKPNKEKYYYKCQCNCGNIVTVAGGNLKNGNTISCGCITSKANEQMAKILTKLDIPFKREYSFPTLKDKALLRYDFALFNNENELIGLIENNGNQHYSARGTQWNTPERLIYTQRHDYMKQKFAEDNKIPLLIIPYQFFDELEKFLITSDFWQIIIKNFND